MKAVIYARYSSDLQSERSIEGQVALCREWLSRAGIDGAEVLADYAVSGASLERPAMTRLREMAKARAIDLLVVEGVDRLSRRDADLHGLLDDLAFHDVRVVGTSDGTDTSREGGRVLIGVRSSMNAEYLRDLGKKTKRGMRERVAAGMAACAVPYGYVTREANGGRAIEVDDATASIVRRIFAEHASGRSVATIASALNAEAVPPPRSSRRDGGCPASWQASTVRAMLANETYAGVWVWNRREWRKVPGRNKRVCRERPRHEWIVREGPAIVERSTWDAANAPKAQPLRERQGRRLFLLSGLLRCGVCGALMAIHGGSDGGHRYYRCSRASAGGVCRNRLSVREADCRETFLAALRGVLLDEATIGDLLDAIAEVLRESTGEVQNERASRLARLARTETKIRRLVDALAEGGSEALAAKVRELEAEARSERLSLAALSAAPAPSDLPTVEEAIEAVREMSAVLSGGDVAAGRERLRSCLDGGSIKATPRGATYVLEAGVLPPMLVGAARSGLAIAGAGFARIRAEVKRAG